MPSPTQTGSWRSPVPTQWRSPAPSPTHPAGSASTSNGTYSASPIRPRSKALFRIAYTCQPIATASIWEASPLASDEAHTSAISGGTSFTDTYAAHATVIRILSQADIVGEEVYGDGLRLLFRLSEAIAQGMTAAASSRGAEPASADQAQHAELTALACLMMLERANYLLSVEVRLPREEMIDRLSAIIYAAFHAA